jgi:hypothetical protein
MSATRLIAASVLCVAAWSAAVEASVVVSFVQPERYRDASRDGVARPASPREPALLEIARYLERLGEQRLTPAQTLRIEVLNVDLAGEVNPMQASTPQTRVLRPASWPRIRLRYTLLEEGGRVRAQGEETIVDMDYQSHGSTISSGDPLRYEKAMLEDWFTRRVAPARR